jgi:hypothetical protein
LRRVMHRRNIFDCERCSATRLQRIHCLVEPIHDRSFTFARCFHRLNDYLQRPASFARPEPLDGALGLPALRSVIPADGRCGCFHPSGPTCRFACPLRPFSSKDWPSTFQPTFADSQSRDVASASGENPSAVRTCPSRARRSCLELCLSQVFGDRSAHVKRHSRNRSSALGRNGLRTCFHITRLRRLLPVPLRSWV